MVKLYFNQKSGPIKINTEVNVDKLLETITEKPVIKNLFELK
jgi:hypothetical protein